jgi:hypothetical protein
MSSSLSQSAPRGLRLTWFALLLFSAAVSIASAAPLAVETLPVDAIEPGMVGEGHTVFDGQNIATFKATILGVLRNYGPNQDLILAKLEGGPLSETGVIAGMSGSPVFIGDKLVGAVSYSFPFSKEAIAGITPIGEMIDATATPAPRRRAARLEFPVTPERVRDIAPAGMRPVAIQGTSMTGVSTLQPYLGKLLSPIATPASLNGFLPETFDIAAPLLRALGMEPLLGGAMVPHPSLQAGMGSIPAPQAGADTTQSLAPGDAVGVGLITGDMDISATGTVTYVDPLTGAVYAFGHPLFNLGPIEYPMTRANVHLILPSLYSSFKLSSSGPTVGTWLQDRYTAIKGTLGSKPRMIPLTVQVQTSRSQQRSYHLGLVHDELFSPILAYISLMSILQTTEREFGTQTVKVSAWISMDENRRVHIEDVFADDQPALSAAAMAAAPLSYLMTNDFEPVDVKSMEVSIEATETPETARLARAWLDTDRVAPGGTVPLKLLLRSYRGEEILETVNVEIPANVGEGKLTLLVADATTISGLERRETQDRFEPNNLDQLIRALNSLRKNNRLYVKLMRPDREGAIVAGEYLSSLPPSVMNILRDDRSSASYIPINNSTLWEYELVTDYSVTGARSLEITVGNLLR